jgi:hypothetical protein
MKTRSDVPPIRPIAAGKTQQGPHKAADRPFAHDSGHWFAHFARFFRLIGGGIRENGAATMESRLHFSNT